VPLMPDDTDVLEELVIHLATQYDDPEQDGCYDFDGNLVSDPDYDAYYRELKKRRPTSEAFAKGTTSPSLFDAEAAGCRWSSIILR
jgi:hypothetical protein